MRLSAAQMLPVGAAALAAGALAGALLLVWPRPMTAPAPVAAPAAVAPAAWNVPAIAGAHLFGAAPAAARAPAAPPPELRLTGVLEAGESDARALIAGPDGVQHPYAPGASLPGGAVLAAIEPRSARVEYAGQTHTLNLPEAALRSAPPRPAARAVGAGTSARPGASPAVLAARARLLRRQTAGPAAPRPGSTPGAVD